MLNAISGPSRANIMEDSYHVWCFEELVDLSQLNDLERVVPVMGSNMVGLRGLTKGTGTARRVCLDAGAMRLVLEWKALMKYLVLGKESQSLYEQLSVEEAIKSFKGVKVNDFIPDEVEARIQTPTDDPNQRWEPAAGWDSPPEEWNLYEGHMALSVKSTKNLENFEDFRDLEDRHTLSQTLFRWSTSKVRAIISSCEN